MTAEKKEPNNLSDIIAAINATPFKVAKPVVGIDPEKDAARDVAESIQKFREDLDRVRVA
ncbi:MAG: hypothetical protein WCD70_11230 [Alphaproteobacteria bacterium]